MATIAITVADADYQRVVEGFCAAMGYMDLVPNPEPPPQLVDTTVVVDEEVEGKKPDPEPAPVPAPVPSADAPTADTYQPMVPNPQTKEDFVQERLVSYLTRTVLEHEQREAATAAATAAAEAVKPLDIS
jgi:outer membrane biosynthesis protein TonB